jgi:hypothetical protein
VVEHEIDQDAEVAGMRAIEQLAEVVERAEVRVDAAVVRDIVAVVAERAGVDGQEPDRADAEVADLEQLLDETPQVPVAVAVRVVERPNVDLIENQIPVPRNGHALPAWGRRPDDPGAPPIGPGSLPRVRGRLDTNGGPI